MIITGLASSESLSAYIWMMMMTKKMMKRKFEDKRILDVEGRRDSGEEKWMVI